MGLLSWIVLGLLAGWIASFITGARAAPGCLTTIAVGVVGALLGGALARSAGYAGITELSLRSILVAALGSVVFLLLLAAVRGRR